LNPTELADPATRKSQVLAGELDANFLDLNLRIDTTGLILWRPNWRVGFY